MAADGQVVIEITGENKELKSVLSDTTTAIKTESKQWGTEAQDASNDISGKLISGFKAVAASTAFIQITKMLAQLGAEAIDTASDLEEVQNVVDVTFGKEGAARIEEWAKRATSQFGLTELQAKQYASTMGAMMKSSGMAGDEIVDMSMAIAGLAADMASFYNLDFDTAFMKIRSGISGETEPLKQLGINMSVANLEAFALTQGITESFDKMSQGQQTLLRYNYLMQATADAQGDFARTAEGYANSRRRIETGIETLKAQIGEILLPIATQVSNSIAEFLEMLTMKPTDALTEASEEIGDAVGKATSAQGILGYMDSLYQRYGDMATQTNEWKKALDELKEVFPEVTQFINEQTGALEISNAELGEYIQQVKNAAIEEAKRNAITEVAQQMVDASQAYYTKEVERDIAQSKADEAFRTIYSMIQQQQKGFTMADAREMGFERMVSYARSINSDVNGVGNQAYVDTEAQIAQLEQIYQTETRNVTTLGNEMETLSVKMESAAAQYDIAVAALGKMTEAAKTAAGALSSVNMSSGQYYNYYYSKVNGSHANGLDYVPFNNYLAALHEGESVLTAQESKVWRAIKNGGLASRNTFDYETLGQTMRDNVRAGGNVYLDGQTVGRVISARQADSYRAMERSGFQQ